MTSMDSYFQNARLSLAAYALLDPSLNSRPTDYVAALKQADMAEEDAKRFVAEYTIIDQSPSDAFGFSATLFEREGQKYLAIRGTDDFIDVFIDFGIFIGSGAVDQYQALEAYYANLIARGKLSPTDQLIVTGHSSGGFLAQGFAVDHPEVVTQAYTYNAPGLGGIAAQILEALGITPSNVPISFVTNLRAEPGLSATASLGTVLGLVQPVLIEASANPSHNHAINTLADSLALYDLFAKLDPKLNTADPAIGIGKITDILKAAANQPPRSLEAVLDSLRKLFKDPNSSVSSLVATETDNREQYYQYLFDLQSRITPYRVALTVEALVGVDPAQLTRLAQDLEAVGYRYALRELNSFAIVGNDAIYDQHNVNGELDLYNPAAGVGMTERYLADRSEMLKWKNLDYAADGQRALRSTRTETYQYTDKTLKDTFGNDLTFTIGGRQLGSVSTPAKIIFGGDAPDSLVGSDLAVGDHLYGSGGDDVLDGQGGNDYLEGGVSSDTLLGGEGDDVLIGGAGNDTLVGGAGRDLLDGGPGFDTYRYFSSDGPDTIADADGQGQIFYDGVLLSGGTKLGPNLWESVDGRFQFTLTAQGDGSQTLGVSGSGTLFVKDFAPGKFGIGLEDAPQPAPTPPAGGREILGIYAPQIFDNPPDLNNPPPGYQYLAITSTADPNDYVLRDDLGNLVRDPARPWTGGHQDLFGSSGGDHIVGSDFGNGLGGLAGDDYLQGGRALDGAGGGEGNDFIEGGSFFEMPLEDWHSAIAFFPEGEIRGASDDRLFGGPGEDVIFGGTAADLEALLDPTTPSAGHKGDWVAGERGDDRLYGSTGHDVLLGGGGKDVMVGGPGDDVLDGDDSFATSHTTNPAAGAWMWRIDIGSSPFGIRFFPISVMPWLNWSESYYKLAGDDDILFAGSGNDILIGMLGDDTLFGEDGDDILSGWEGGDTLLGGEGNDHIAGDFGRYEQPNDRLVGFTHSVPAGFLDVNTGDSGLVDQTGNDYLDGGAGNDTLYGEGGNDIVLGGEGNDTLWGDAAYLPVELHGADYLDGGAGADTLNGGSGDDTLAGGLGNDTLDGDEGSDTYIFARGGGQDVISDQGAAGVDVLIVNDYARADVTIRREAGGSLAITSVNGDAITIQEYAGNAGSGIELIQFADGTTLDRDALNALSIADGSIGGAGWTQATAADDVIATFGLPSGTPGGFVLVDAGAGNDTVFGGPDAVIYGNQGDDQLLGGHTLIGGDGDDLLTDGVVLVGGVGDDRLLNGAILNGGAGNDTLDGSYGATRYLIAASDVGIDTITDSGESQDAILDGYYSSLGVFDWRERQFLTQPEYVVIEFGSFATLEEASAALAEFFGLTWEEALASGFASVLEPLPPAPQIAANDYAALAPFYESGVIELDRVEFGEGIALADLALIVRHRTTVNGSDVVGPEETLEISWGEGRGVVVRLPRADDLPGTGVEQFQFADGSVLTTGELISLASQAFEITGSAADDFITGTAAAEVIQGGPGNDTLDGGEGNDTHVFNAGDGVDTITDSGGFDTLSFGPGITPEILTLGLGSLLIGVSDTGDAIHIEGFDPNDVLGSGAIEQFQFANGTSLTYGQLVTRGFDLFGTAGDDILSGTNVEDRINGLAGNDVLQGGTGSDAYVFGTGSGQDVIREVAAPGDTDTLQILANPGDVTVTREEDSLVLAIRGSEDQVTLFNWFASDAEKVEQAIFADGTAWDVATLQAMSGAAPNTAPTLANAIANQTGQEDAAFSFTLPAGTFVDADAGDTLGFTATRAGSTLLPGWLAFDAATQSFSGTPANDDVGTLDITVTATDAGGLSDSDVFTLTVANVNDVPVLATPIADQAALEDAAFSFALSPSTFTDVDAGDVLTFRAARACGAPLPPWLAFDAATQTFSGTPTNDDVGSLSLEVIATDTAEAAAASVFHLTVENVNDAPQLVTSLADQFGNQNALFTFTVSEGAFRDVDAGDALRFSTTLADGSPLPAWLGFGPLSRSFTGTPSEFDVGNLDIRVTATDNAGATASDTFTLSVSDASTVNETYMGTRRRDAIVTGFANDLIETGRGDDIVHAGAGRDIVFGARGEDRLYGEAGNDRLYGGKGSDVLEGGAGADLLSGGAGHDQISGGEGENTLIGGRGHDVITGGPGGEVFLVNFDDGKDTLRLSGAALAGNEDVLSLGGGIAAGALYLRRDHDDLIVQARDADEREERARVILEDWYRDAGDHQTVTTLQLFDGGTAVTYDFKELIARFDAETQGRHPTHRWSAVQALPAVQLTSGAEPLGGDITREYATSGTVLGDEPLADEDAEERAALPGGDWDPLPASNNAHPLGSNGKHDSDRGEHHSKGKRESPADLLEAYLGQKPHYNFEALARELERSERHAEALNAQEIARRWRVVGQHASALSNEHDEDARGGADYRFNNHGLLGGSAFGGGFGYSGSTGALRRVANLQTLQGLEEGLERLHA